MPTVPQYTSLAASAYRGVLPGDYNPIDVPLDVIERMRRRDPIVRYAYRHLTRSVRKRIGDYTHPDERVQEWVTSHVLPAAVRDLSRLQKACYYGVALAQPRYGLDRGELRLLELVGCAAQRFWNGRGFRRDEAGTVDAVDLDAKGWMTFLDEQSGSRQLIHYATGDDDGGPWGEASARLAYTAWYIKHRLLSFEAIGLEKHAVATAVFKVHDDVALENGKTRSEQYVTDWQLMGSASAVAVDREDELDVVYPGWGAANPFIDVIRRLDGYIFNSFFMPMLLTQEAQHGTRAQATVALETYLMAETDLAEELADQVLIDQIIAPAIALQFGPGREPGDLTVRDPAPPDLEAWARILQMLDSIGAFSAEVDEQLQWAGKRFGVPMDDLSQLLATGVTLAREPLG